MADENLLSDIHRLHTEGQERYVYFLLASTGAAIGYGLQQLDGVALSLWSAPALQPLAAGYAGVTCTEEI
ncbi:MAG: hypothetical protein O2971_16610 [Proteobacteria bacterium]|nr:hypothetical protein [Pseudomonadota bacterium]